MIRNAWLILVIAWMIWLFYIYQAAAQNGSDALGGVFEAIIFWGSALIGFVIFIPTGLWAFWPKKKDKV